MGLWLTRELRRKNIDLVDLRRTSKKLVRASHQSRCHLAGKMRIAPTFIGECIENSKRALAHPYCEPGNGARLLIDKRQCRTKKLCHVVLFPRLGLKWNVKR